MFNAEQCGISEEGVEQIAMISQLEELVLGRPWDYSDEPAAENMWTYMAIFKNMKRLKQLEMRHPDLQELNLRRQWVIQTHVKSEMCVASSSSRTCRDSPSLTSVIHPLKLRNEQLERPGCALYKSASPSHRVIHWYASTHSGRNNIGDDATGLMAMLPLLVRLDVGTCGG